MTPFARARIPPATRVEIEQTVALLRQIKTLPLTQRRGMLEGLRGHGRRVRELLAKANREIRRIERRGCSMPMIDAATKGRQTLPTKGMARSQHRTRIGDAAGTVPTRRLMPRHAVELEDRYDGMTTFEATICSDPPSVTGMQLQELRARRRG